MMEEAMAEEGEAMADEACAYGGLFKAIEAVDDMTVKFSLCSPDVAFPSKVAFTALTIHPAEYLESTGGSGDILDAPIGTGPYQLVEWNRGESVVFKAFADYWGEPAKTENLIFRWSAEGAQRLLELQSGAVDGIDNPTPDDFAVIEADDSLALFPREALNIFYVGMANIHPPFDNELVRQAIAVGLDRGRIVDNFYPAGSVVASHFTPCAIPGGCEGAEWPAYDPDRAKELLAEAGFPDGFETTIAYRDVVRGYLPEPGVVAQDIQAQLADIGIKVTIEVMESGAFLDAADRALGVPPMRILFRDVLPNAITPLIVQGTLGIGTAIVEVAALSFLGLGAQPPTPEWGLMVSAERNQVFTAPFLIFIPGVAIAMVVLGFNLLGDGLQDALNPRLNRR